MVAALGQSQSKAEGKGQCYREHGPLQGCKTRIPAKPLESEGRQGGGGGVDFVELKEQEIILGTLYLRPKAR